MQSSKNYFDMRSEPRFRPDFEKLRWQKPGCAEIEAGEILDVSQTGLSFRIPAGEDSPLKAGDEISIGFAGYDDLPENYAIVWEKNAQGGLAVGCSRLLSKQLVAAGGDGAPKLVLGERRDDMVVGRDFVEPETESVVVGAKPSN